MVYFMIIMVVYFSITIYNVFGWDALITFIS